MNSTLRAYALQWHCDPHSAHRVHSVVRVGGNAWSVLVEETHQETKGKKTLAVSGIISIAHADPEDRTWDVASENPMLHQMKQADAIDTNVT